MPKASRFTHDEHGAYKAVRAWLRLVGKVDTVRPGIDHATVSALAARLLLGDLAAIDMFNASRPSPLWMSGFPQDFDDYRTEYTVPEQEMFTVNYDPDLTISAWSMSLCRVLVDRSDRSIWFRGSLSLSEFDYGASPVIFPTPGTIAERAFFNAFVALMFTYADGHRSSGWGHMLREQKKRAR